MKKEITKRGFVLLFFAIVVILAVSKRLFISSETSDSIPSEELSLSSPSALNKPMKKWYDRLR